MKFPRLPLVALAVCVASLAACSPTPEPTPVPASPTVEAVTPVGYYKLTYTSGVEQRQMCDAWVGDLDVLGELLGVDGLAWPADEDVWMCRYENPDRDFIDLVVTRDGVITSHLYATSGKFTVSVQASTVAEGHVPAGLEEWVQARADAVEDDEAWWVATRPEVLEDA